MEDKAAVGIAPAPNALEDEYPPGEEPLAKGRKKVKDTKKETSGAAEEDEEPPPPGVDVEEHKKETSDDPDNLEELTEQKKNSSLGAVLSGLSTGSFGSKAKENIVKVEVTGPRKRYHNDNWGPNKRFGGGGRGGGGQFDGGWGGGGWGGSWGGNNWNSWNDEYNNYGGYDKYEEEPDEDDTSANEAWIAEETKLLEEEFGPGIISIMYDDEGGMTYVCDICQSQLNGRKSLDVHINGMKHLKKKNIWEKKRRLENFKETEGETDQKKSDTDNSVGGKDTKQGGIPSLYTQPPPPVTGMHPVSFPPPLTVPPNQWNTPPPPPPAAKAVQVEVKPKTNLSGGATGTLLQKLAACAVKNLKDSDLATNVIIALVKTMKEYNHKRGDTRSIEVLTEIDIKLRGLKSMMPAILLEAEKTVSKTATKTSASDVSNKENTPKSASVIPNPSKPSGNSYYTSSGTGGSEASKYSSSGSGSKAYPSIDSGTWYSQGKGNAASSYPTQSTDTKKAPSNTNYTSQPPNTNYTTPNSNYTSQLPPKTGYSTNTKASTDYTNDYASYNMTRTQTQHPQTRTQTQNPPTRNQTENPPIHTQTQNPPIHTQTQNPPIQTQTQNPPIQTQTQNPPIQTQTQNPPIKDAGGYEAKPPVGYFSQPPYGQPPAAVMGIISTAPPPPPPVDNSGYAGYGNQYTGGYGSYYNTGPPGPQANGYPMKY